MDDRRNQQGAWWTALACVFLMSLTPGCATLDNLPLVGAPKGPPPPAESGVLLPDGTFEAATITDPNYVGSAVDTFTINPAPATVTLSAMTQTYTGAPPQVTRVIDARTERVSRTGFSVTPARKLPPAPPINNTLVRAGSQFSAIRSTTMRRCGRSGCRTAWPRSTRSARRRPASCGG